MAAGQIGILRPRSRLAVIVLAMAVAHPWLTGCLAICGVVYVTVREGQRRRALAARADWEHRALMAAPMPELPRPRQPRRRLADHWSTTELMRMGMR